MKIKVGDKLTRVLIRDAYVSGVELREGDLWYDCEVLEILPGLKVRVIFDRKGIHREGRIFNVFDCNATNFVYTASFNKTLIFRYKS